MCQNLTHKYDNYEDFKLRNLLGGLRPGHGPSFLGAHV